MRQTGLSQTLFGFVYFSGWELHADKRSDDSQNGYSLCFKYEMPHSYYFGAFAVLKIKKPFFKESSLTHIKKKKKKKKKKTFKKYKI